MTRRAALFVALMTFGGACGGGGSAVDAALFDAEADVARDGTRVDASIDTKVDAGVDAGADQSPYGSAMSFDIRATLEIKQPGGAITTATETLFVSYDVANSSLVISWHGRVDIVGATVDGPHLYNVDAVVMDDPCLPRGLEITDLDLRRSGDGVVGGLSGTWLEYSGGNAEKPFTGTFTGVRDVTPPTLGYCSFQSRTIRVPTDNIHYIFSEPLASNAAVQLVREDGNVIDLVPPSLGPPASEFATFDALAFGHSYRLRVLPFIDLAGNPGNSALLPILVTPPLGFAVEDGFETDWPKVTTAGVKLVTAAAWPPLSGAHSLFIPAGGTISARFHVAPTDRSVKLSIRPILPEDFDIKEPFPFAAGFIRLGTPGGEVIESDLPQPTAPYQKATGGLLAARADDVHFDLPTGVTDEVIVTIFTEGGSADETPYPNLLIDNLRVE